MDQRPDNVPGLGLPQPSNEQGAASSSVPIPVAVPQPGAQSVPLAPIAGGLSPTGQDVSGDDNSDALDEEWVNKAKAIVERTKSDPHQESKEISKAKADYLRLRYNKQIKVAEES